MRSMRLAGHVPRPCPRARRRGRYPPSCRPLARSASAISAPAVTCARSLEPACPPGPGDYNGLFPRVTVHSRGSSFPKPYIALAPGITMRRSRSSVNGGIASRPRARCRHAEVFMARFPTWRDAILNCAAVGSAVSPLTGAPRAADAVYCGLFNTSSPGAVRGTDRCPRRGQVRRAGASRRGTGKIPAGLGCGRRSTLLRRVVG